MKKGWIIVAAVILAALLTAQIFSVANLRAQVRALQAQLQTQDSSGAPAVTTVRTVTAPASLGSLPQRVAQLEQSVTTLARTAETLMERGLVPPTAERIEQMQARFFDPSTSDRDRLRAFQLMRRNGAVSDDVLAHAMGWLQSSTNTGTRRDLLRQMDGLTNSTLKQPLLAMLSSETNGGVREELVDTLADFASDPAVEQKLWDLALNDQDGDVREEARDALTDGRMTPERVASLQQKANDPNLSIDARLLALQGLSEADASAPEAVAQLADLAQNSSDPILRAKLFEAFDDIRDPSLMVPLVYGLQDPNPVIRERAADALGSYGSDERVQQWLNHVIQNDTDPRVKREAFQALQQSQRRQENRRGN